MKYLFLILTLVSLSFGCSKNSPTTYSEVTITSFDMTMTPCSGGYMGIIDNKNYRISEVVKNDILTQNTKFPKTYIVKYGLLTGLCYNQSEGLTNIVVTEIKEK